MSHGKRAAKRVLVLGDYRQTITAVRSLARAGFEVLLGTDDPRSSTAMSRHVSQTWTYERTSAERFCDQLESFLRLEQPAFVFAVGESQLRRLVRDPGRFERLSCWTMPDPETIERCFDKRQLYALCPSLGIPVPEWHEFTTASDWRARALAMGLPLIIKRKDSALQVRGRKALILRTQDELETFLVEVHADPDPGSLVLQKLAPGARHNCHIAAADGELLAYFEQKVLRTDELDDTGIGTAGISVEPTARLRGHCERLLKALDYTGIGCVQFLVDGNEVAFLEVNPRMDSTAALPYRLGYDFPRLAIRLAAYRKARSAGLQSLAACLRPGPVLERYAIGERYHWLYGEMHAWREATRDGGLAASDLASWALELMASALVSHHLTFEAADPLPTLHAYWKKYARNPARRARLFRADVGAARYGG